MSGLSFESWLTRLKCKITMDRSMIKKARNLFFHNWSVEGAAEQLKRPRMVRSNDSSESKASV